MHEMAPLLNPTKGDYMIIVARRKTDMSTRDNINWKLDRRIIRYIVYLRLCIGKYFLCGLLGYHIITGGNNYLFSVWSKLFSGM
jgi:hypothetical protein